ncbi:MAG: GAF domain-containing sensor histidine kinase [Anaerolineales bacterium]|nr:MAG: GAF domain-containing sensor histidine kinase [Anaerolineales bacterium]
MGTSDLSAVSKNLDRALAGRVTPAETQAADKDQRLSTIFEMAKILATQQDLETMLSKLLSCLIDTLEAAEAGALLLHDPSDERLTVRAARGYDLTSVRQIHLAPGEATCGKTFQTGQAELYPTPEAISAETANLSSANRELFRAATIGLRPPQSAVCIPMFTGQTKVGVLTLVNRRQPGSFVPADLPFLRAVADLIALSIENARLSEELQATQALEEANRLKSELISTLAHEMRTPLTSIKGYSTALLMEETSFDPATQQEFLRIIDEECDTLQDLIYDLLESSIIDAGLLRLEPQPVMLPRLVKSLTDDIANHAQKHRFLVDFPSHFPIVDADPQRITQVLRNLLDNAVKYSPQGGLVVVRGEVREDEVVISVADQGVGIAPEHLNRLFEKFFRVESGLGRHVVGSGLGLPIAQTIVESHGGRIWAESQVGQGTTLYFTLPLKGLSQELAGQAEGEAE